MTQKMAWALGQENALTKAIRYFHGMMKMEADICAPTVWETKMIFMIHIIAVNLVQSAPYLARTVMI